MFRDKKLTIAIIIVLMISVIGLGIAFAAFSQTLTINGTGTVEASKWQVVFEGADGSNTLGAPTLTGTAEVITAPTIKNNQTEISTYSVSLKTPGDSVTYNFKIHNKGDYAATISSIVVANKTNPIDTLSGIDIANSYSQYSSNRNTLDKTYYKFYYTDNNSIVGREPEKDCLEPGESENVTLKITFASTSDTNKNILPKSNLVLNNLGVSINYNQLSNGHCYFIPSEPVSNINFVNYDGAYYSYESKSFIGTGVDNVIITENIIGQAEYASTEATECSDGSVPTGDRWDKECPTGTTPVFTDHPAKDMAAAYCTGCRLMTLTELSSWSGVSMSQINSCEMISSRNDCGAPKCMAKYNGNYIYWFLEEAYNAGRIYTLNASGYISAGAATNPNGVRPAVSIPSTATMSGSGTQQDPYVITP